MVTHVDQNGELLSCPQLAREGKELVHRSTARTAIQLFLNSRFDDQRIRKSPFINFQRALNLKSHIRNSLLRVSSNNMKWNETVATMSAMRAIN